jgi:hypothetical protein
MVYPKTFRISYRFKTCVDILFYDFKILIIALIDFEFRLNVWTIYFVYKYVKNKNWFIDFVLSNESQNVIEYLICEHFNIINKQTVPKMCDSSVKVT